MRTLLALIASVVVFGVQFAYAKPPTAKQVAVVAIKKVFKSRWAEAMRVAGCETGYTYSTRSRNGQYLGLFQMGSWERRTYGHGDTALKQAQAAYRYFVASGRSWKRWECQP